MNDIILQKAFKHLSRDNVMNYLISKFSDKIDWGNRFDTNNAKSIANLIIEQQISFKAAITIKKRFSELIKNKSNLGTMFKKEGCKVEIKKGLENSLSIFDANLIHAIPPYLPEERYSIAIDLIKK